MDGDRRAAATEPGLLAGLPVAIKDPTDVAGVRTTYGSPIFRDHVPAKSHPPSSASPGNGVLMPEYS